MDNRKRLVIMINEDNPEEKEVYDYILSFQKRKRSLSVIAIIREYMKSEKKCESINWKEINEVTIARNIINETKKEIEVNIEKEKKIEDSHKKNQISQSNAKRLNFDSSFMKKALSGI